MPSTPSSTASP
jgi:hypothetical protein